jgi:hypothetical protein
MLLPILPIDYELASPGDLEVGPDYRAARVFVRWHGVPIAVIQVPVVTGKVRGRDVGKRIMARQQGRLAREMARRAPIPKFPTRRPPSAWPSAPGTGRRT